MRRLGALLWLAVLGFSLYNWWQIEALRRELAEQRAAVRVSERTGGITGKLQQALRRGEHARTLLDRGRYKQAAAELDRAISELTDAARPSDPVTAERLQRFEETLARVRDQTQSLIRRVTPASDRRSDGG
jgi:hypothetical protein